MGLHKDPTSYGLPPFEVEQRRRLWWNIVGYERRVGEITGSTVTALSSGGDCKIPLNVNDNDLHVNGKELPKPYPGPTEMLFALTRMEIAMAIPSASNRDSFNGNNPDKGASPPDKNQDFKSPVATIKIAGQDSPPYTLDGFCAHIEENYLSQCDPKIPFHLFTLIMIRQKMCQMRVTCSLVRMHNSEKIPLKEIEQDSLFFQAVQMIEYDNVIQSSESLLPFKWYSTHHFPFQAYIILFQELRHRTRGQMVERAWDAVAANIELHGSMHEAFSGLFIKAWDAYEGAQVGISREGIMPKFVTTLQDCAAKSRKARAENSRDPSLQQQPYNIQSSQGPRNAMMTPPIDPNNPDVAPSIIGMGLPSEEDAGYIDWSYTVSGYQGMPLLQGTGGFAGLNSPMGGMGPGIDPGMGPGMDGGMGNMGGSPWR